MEIVFVDQAYLTRFAVSCQPSEVLSWKNLLLLQVQLAGANPCALGMSLDG
jgi:hypothetical protein